LQLDPTIGFVPFQAQSDCLFFGVLPLHRTSRTMTVHPRNAIHTPRRIPLASSRTTSLWPLPSCCSTHLSRTEVWLRSALKTNATSRSGCHYGAPSLALRELPLPGFPSTPVGMRSSQLQGFTPLASPWREKTVAGCSHPILPWALFPFKGIITPLHRHTIGSLGLANQALLRSPCTPKRCGLQ